MSAYELMYLARPELDDDALQALADKLSGVITAEGGAVDEVEKLGKRRFAYEIDDVREGHYTLLIFKGPVDLPAELDRVIRLTDEIVRHLIVKHVPVSQPPPRQAPRPLRPADRPDRPIEPPVPRSAEPIGRPIPASELPAAPAEAENPAPAPEAQAPVEAPEAPTEAPAEAPAVPATEDAAAETSNE